MDGKTFDGLARLLADPTTRRRFLGRVAGVVLAGQISRVGRGRTSSALAACGTTGNCVGDQRCCNGLCTFVRNSSIHCGYCNHSCPAGEKCREGRCVCATWPSCEDGAMGGG